MVRPSTRGQLTRIHSRQWGVAILLFTLLTAVHFYPCWWLGRSYCTTIDMYNQHYPITLGAVKTLLAGDFPLWCPWRGSGTPWFATTSANLLDPFVLWLQAFPDDRGMTLRFASQTFAAALAFYAALRYWRLPHRPALAMAARMLWFTVCRTRCTLFG